MSSLQGPVKRGIRISIFCNYGHTSMSLEFWRMAKTSIFKYFCFTLDFYSFWLVPITLILLILEKLILMAVSYTLHLLANIVKFFPLGLALIQKHLWA